jgi:hypothetical protein
MLELSLIKFASKYEVNSGYIAQFGQKWPFLDFLNTGKYRQIFAGIGIWSPKYRYSGIGIYRIGITTSTS